MIRVSLGLMLIALTTLMMELTLIRVFDVIWYPNLAYMVITLAMFSFGLSGVWSALHPPLDDKDPARSITRLAAVFGMLSVALLPLLNRIPFDLDLLYTKPLQGLALFMLIYLALAAPFFLSGLIFTTVFSVYAERIRNLYFWDLTGAALGCIVLVPFLPHIGPGGLLMLAGALALAAAALFAPRKATAIVCLALSLGLLSIPWVVPQERLEFREHINKRGLKQAREEGNVEYSRWDPISKIDVIDQSRNKRKHVAYDGGTQSTFIFPFDGDFDSLRQSLPDKTMRNFTGENVLVSHFLKRDRNSRVLVIGSAGGQEIKAALTYGAGQVDAVELVETVVRLGKEKYASYNGHIFNHPRVNAMVGEGRSFLRASGETYDIIQIFSNHTSSSMAAGTGAMATSYLQTAEAYQEYFRHLAPEGVLHINHHVYPRVITTAALAWKQMGRGDFRRHVAVFEATGQVQDNLPTVLIKMTPWSEAEVETLRAFFKGNIELVENPLHSEQGFLSEGFYTGELRSKLARRVPYRVQAATDNRPFFNFLRKHFHKLKPDPQNFLNFSIAALLNSQLKAKFFPRDVIHLFVTGLASVFFTVLFILVPLFCSEAGRARWPGKGSTLTYFACLGAAFIIIELVFIHLFMKLIGYPLYTYSTVVFALLLAAATGSGASGPLGITLQRRWHWPFVGTLGYGLLLLWLHPHLFDLFLTSPTVVRILVAVALIFPLGFFMGMPFPLGILALKDRPRGAIAWAWGLNGLFTVVGGFLSVLLSLFWGFRQSILLALLTYALAAAMLYRLRRHCPACAPDAAS